MKKTGLLLLCLMLASAASAQGQGAYRLTIEWMQRDPDGRVMSHNIAKGDVSELSRQSIIENRNLINDWSLTKINGQERETTQLAELEGVEFSIVNDNFTKAEYYKDFPPTQVDLMRWIVQDKVTFDMYAYLYADSLQLNVPYYPDFLQNHQADFEQYVNFNTQKLSLTWLGTSEMNGKECNLIYFRAMYNPIDSDDDVMAMSGRSCFWGHIWISVDAKEIEHATMNEDLVYKFRLKANDFSQTVNMQRDVVYEKLD